MYSSEDLERYIKRCTGILYSIPIPSSDIGGDSYEKPINYS